MYKPYDWKIGDKRLQYEVIEIKYNEEGKKRLVLKCTGCGEIIERSVYIDNLADCKNCKKLLLERIKKEDEEWAKIVKKMQKRYKKKDDVLYHSHKEWGRRHPLFT